MSIRELKNNDNEDGGTRLTEVDAVSGSVHTDQRPHADTGAELSADRTYRYRLWRRWDSELFPVVWVMLNPSTADENFDDPTIRKCIGFARRWGYGGIEVVNLYAYRSTDPKQLKKVADPGGPGNYAVISRVSCGRTVVCGWGRNAERNHVWRILQTLRDVGADIKALKINADESPMHPLYVPYETPLMEYPRRIGAR